MCDGNAKCQKPEELKGKPQDCSPEQIRKCHGDVAEHPCEATGCQQPENLEGRPQDCSPEQVRTCHGDDAGHPCVGRSK
jgi:hypothetical protein